jgi:short-subunit dehydrogenase
MHKPQRVVITGANSGIGLALIEQSIERGDDIVAVDLKTDILTLRYSHHDNLHNIQLDLSNSNGIDTLFDFLNEHWGYCDIFFANAGFAYYENIANQVQPDWKRNERIFSLNTLSPIYSWQKLQQLNSGRPAKIVMTASAMAHIGLPGYALYSATKAALHSFASTQRWESTQPSEIVLVYPIATRTNFFNSAGSKPPFPSQSTQTVAKKIFKGIDKNKQRIYPSLLFTIYWRLAQWFPFLATIYQKIEAKRISC